MHRRWTEWYRRDSHFKKMGIETWFPFNSISNYRKDAVSEVQDCLFRRYENGKNCGTSYV